MPKRKTKSAKSSGRVTTGEGFVRNETTGFGGPRGTAFEGDWLKLAEACGGIQALATALGTTYPTLYRWAVKGEPVPSMSRQVIGMLAAQKNLPNPAIPK